MCVAIPGKVLSVEGTMAQVDFKGNTVNVNVGLVDPQRVSMFWFMPDAPLK